MSKGKNIRTAKMSPGMGMDDRKRTPKEAHQTAAWKSKNETTEYTTGGSLGPGAPGGKNANL